MGAVATQPSQRLCLVLSLTDFMPRLLPVCLSCTSQAAIGGGMMLISASNITLTDTSIEDNIAQIDPNKVN